MMRKLALLPSLLLVPTLVCAQPTADVKAGSGITMAVWSGTWEATTPLGPFNGNLTATPYVLLPKPLHSLEVRLPLAQLFPDLAISGFAQMQGTIANDNQIDFAVSAPGLVGQTVNVTIGGTPVAVQVTAVVGNISLWNDTPAAWLADWVTGDFRTIDTGTTGNNNFITLEGTTGLGNVVVTVKPSASGMSGNLGIARHVRIRNGASQGFWRTNGDGGIMSWQSLPPLPAGWGPGPVGDYDKDGYDDDISLLQNVTNRFGFYYTQFGAYTGWRNLGLIAGGLTMKDGADMNSDGHEDLVVQNNATRRVGVYYTNGLGWTGYTNFLLPPVGWDFVEMVDVDRDGFEDAVLMNTVTRKIGCYLMRNTTVVGWRTMMTLPAGFNIVGFGEFENTGDMAGYYDMLIHRPATNQLSAYTFMGHNLVTWKFVANMRAGWSPLSVGNH